MGPLIWPCLEKGKERRRKDVRERERERKRKRERKKKFKDDTRSLDRLKTKRKSMQKLEESH